jgi:hypothetical protein
VNFGSLFQGTLDRRNVARLAQQVEDALETLAAQIATGWQSQHGPDGEHLDITATSVTTPLIKATGRVVFNNIVRVGLSASTPVAPLYPVKTAGDVSATNSTIDPQHFNFLRVRPKTGVDTVRGLTNIGRQDGDVIIIYNIGNVDLILTLIDAAAPVGTQFIDDTSTTETTFGQFILGPAGWCFGLYSKHEFFNATYWNLLGVRQP